MSIRTAPLAVVLAFGGCSFGVRGPDPRAPAEVQPVCETAAPGRFSADILGGALTAAAGGIVGWAGECAGEYDDCENPVFTGILVGAILSAPWWLAIYSGHTATAECCWAWERHRAALEPRPRVDPAVAERRRAEAERRARIECADDLAAWRQERDRWRKWGLYDRMPLECRALADQEQ